MPDRVVIAFDTAAAHCAAALLCGDSIVASRIEKMPRGQAERLMGLLQDMLDEGGLGWPDVTRIGVGVGPGNFTGIRISVAAARGLALGLGVPAVGVSTHEALAFGAAGPVLVATAAPRERIYLQADDRLSLCAADELPDLPRGAVCIGDRAEIPAHTCGGTIARPAHPLAEAIARIAATREVVPGTRPAPIYLRPADAAPARPGPRIVA